MRRNLWLGVAIMVIFALTGCGYSMFAAKTTVHVSVLPDGTCAADYTSDKEENDLAASVCGGTVSVKKAGSQAEAVTAMMQFQAGMLALYQKLTDQIATLTAIAGKTAATTGS